MSSIIITTERIWTSLTGSAGSIGRTFMIRSTGIPGTGIAGTTPIRAFPGRGAGDGTTGVGDTPRGTVVTGTALTIVIGRARGVITDGIILIIPGTLRITTTGVADITIRETTGMKGVRTAIPMCFMAPMDYTGATPLLQPIRGLV